MCRRQGRLGLFNQRVQGFGVWRDRENCPAWGRNVRSVHCFDLSIFWVLVLLYNYSRVLRTGVRADYYGIRLIFSIDRVERNDSSRVHAPKVFVGQVN
jgi:hypothetical protein